MKKRKMSQAAAILMAITMAVSMMTGCGGKTSQSAETAGSKTEAASDEDGSRNGDRHINVAFFWIAADLDPANDYNGWVLSRLGVGESLVKLNDDLKVEACLADSWKNLNDTTCNYNILKNVT